MSDDSTICHLCHEGFVNLANANMDQNGRYVHWSCKQHAWIATTKENKGTGLESLGGWPYN